MKKISVVIPFYNEKENLERIYEELVSAHRSSMSGYDLEILFMDNHSGDGSYEVAKGIAEKDPRTKVLRLSRNFGYQANILAGFLNASGDAVVQLDADGEDDPTLIPQMVSLWEAGNKVVYGVRKSRKESWILSLQRKLFYRVIRFLSSVDLPVDSGDFRLLDKQVISSLSEFREASPYLRGLISYIGFQQASFPYHRRPRYRGISKFSWWSYFELAWDGITSFSRKPLVVAAWVGAALAGASFLGAGYYLGLYFIVGTGLPGFTTLVLLQLFLAGVQLLCIGVIGTYLGRVFEEVKQRPRSIVERRYPEASDRPTSAS
jgi:polyisoprenyl-phosphate glycosyltransferase